MRLFAVQTFMEQCRSEKIFPMGYRGLLSLDRPTMGWRKQGSISLEQGHPHHVSKASRLFVIVLGLT